MKLKEELPPKTDNIKRCCHHDTYVSAVQVPVRLMSDPPQTTDRWVRITRWQCHITERHFGEVWETTDESLS